MLIAVLKCCFCFSCTVYSLVGDFLSFVYVTGSSSSGKVHVKLVVVWGNLSGRRGQHLVFSAALGYFEIRGKAPAFVSPAALVVLEETLGFLLVVRGHLSSSCRTREVVFCFSPQICCTSYFSPLVVPQLKGLNRGGVGICGSGIINCFPSAKLFIMLLVQMQLGFTPSSSVKNH